MSKSTFYIDLSDSEDVSSSSEEETAMEEEKHVVFVEQNLTLQYRPKCYSMPDLLQVCISKEGADKHPNLQLGTRVKNDNINIKSYLPKKTPLHFKRKLSDHLKDIKGKILTSKVKTGGVKCKSDSDVPTKELDPAKEKSVNGKSKHYLSVPHPLKCMNILHSVESKYQVSYASADTTKRRQRSRSVEILNYIDDETHLLTSSNDKPFSQGFNRRLTNYRNRIFSDQTTSERNYFPLCINDHAKFFEPAMEENKDMSSPVK